MKTSLTQNLFKNRFDLLLAFLSIVVVSIANSIVASVLVAKYASSMQMILYICLSVIVAFLILLIVNVYKQLISEQKIEAVIIYDSINNEIIGLPDYDFCDKIRRSLNGAFVDNAGIKAAWDDEPIETKDSFISEPDDSTENGGDGYTYVAIKRMDDDRDISQGDGEGIKLTNEAIETVLLEYISLHLSSYFNSYSDEDSYIQKFSRKNLPNFILENRVLSSLTTPLKDRGSLRDFYKKDNGEGEIVTVFRSDGAVFNNLELVLPKGSRILRIEKGFIIDSPRVKIQINYKFDRVSHSFPFQFENWLFSSFEKYTLRTYGVDINMKTIIKPMSMMLFGKWKYFSWAESLADFLSDRADINNYFERLGWDQFLLHIIDVRRGEREKNPPEETTSSKNE